MSITINQNGVDLISQSPTLDITNIHRKAEGCCLTDLPIENIIVFSNKAEITRSLRYEIFSNQYLELCLEQLPSTIDRDSIRVEIPNKLATIQDVTFNTKPLNQNNTSHERLKQIDETIKSLKIKIESLEAKNARFTRQKSVIETFASTLMYKQSEVAEEINDNGLDPYDPKHLDTVRNFFELYDDKAEKFDEAIQETSHSIEDINAKLASLNSERTEIELRLDELLYRELLLMLECHEDGEMEIIISYIVRNSTWRPTYDIRVSNENGSMQIYYFGVVKQSSCEDWYQPNKFVLSTTEPSLGGTVPEMGVQKIQFRSPLEAIRENFIAPPLSPAISGTNIRRSPSKFSSFRKSKSTSMQAVDFSTFASLSPTLKTSPISGSFPVNDTVDSNNTTPETSHQQKPFPQNNVQSVSVTYDVARPPALITCDNKEVKVMIGIINLEPIYSHVTVPRLSLHAYQRAVCRNTSNYTFLEGPAFLYVNSCFIGKTQLKTTYSCEDFTCNLGMDKDVLVKYQPLIKVKDNNHNKFSVTYKQEIHVCNMHERPIKITVIDQIPIATEGEKIKVNLLEPSIKSDKNRNIRKNENGQFEWDHEIGPKVTKEMILKFSVEHPADREIEILNIK